MATIAGDMPFVTRYEACRAVLRDIESFSNASGFKAPGVVIPAEDRLLGELDPPRHTLVRRVVVTALTPRVVHEAEPFMAETARRLLDAIPVPGTGDLVPAFTVSLPNRVTVHLLGLPADDADQLAAWAKELMESGFPATNRSERGEGFAAAFPDFAGYIDDQIARIETHPEADDVLARLVFLESDGERLPAPAGAGARPQPHHRRAHHDQPAARQPGPPGAHRPVGRGRDARQRRGPDRRDRGEPPTRAAGDVHLPRLRARDGDRGRDITEGERVVVGTGSANRDEQVFADGATFDPTRENADAAPDVRLRPARVPGRGAGPHRGACGAHQFFERFPAGTVRLAEGFRYENVPTFFEVGPRRLPIETRPAG